VNICAHCHADLGTEFTAKAIRATKKKDPFGGWTYYDGDGNVLHSCERQQ
jgi:hypothetical protein